jgi:hypothetical protein
LTLYEDQFCQKNSAEDWKRVPAKKINFDLITAFIWSYHVRHHVHNDTSAGRAWFLFPDHAPYNFKPSHAWKAGWDLEWLQIITDGLSIRCIDGIPFVRKVNPH